MGDTFGKRRCPQRRGSDGRGVLGDAASRRCGTGSSDDADYSYENGVCTYEKTYADGSRSRVPWRCSVGPAYSEWLADRHTSVDFTTMVFGYASNFVRPYFWDLYSM